MRYRNSDKIIIQDANLIEQHYDKNLRINDYAEMLAITPNHLTQMDRTDLDQIEKILMALIPLTDICQNNFVSLIPILDELHNVYTKTKDNEDSIYINILTNLRNFRRSLQQISSKDL